MGLAALGSWGSGDHGVQGLSYLQLLTSLQILCDLPFVRMRNNRVFKLE